MYRIVGIILLILFYIIYYGKAISQKKKGIKTNQIKNQKKGIEYTIGVLMGLGSFIVCIGEIVSICLNISHLPSTARIVGIAIALVGDIIFYLSVTTMGTNWRAGVSKSEKTQLVSHGIYGISRNPAFLGFDLVYIGIMLMFFSWWLLAITIFTIVMLHLQIVKVEEPFLKEQFGEEYATYNHKVCRYIGRKF